jgi:hypothetical protein
MFRVRSGASLGSSEIASLRAGFEAEVLHEQDAQLAAEVGFVNF